MPTPQERQVNRCHAHCKLSIKYHIHIIQPLAFPI